MEENIPLFYNSKTLDRMIYRLKTQDKTLVTKIKQKIKQRSLQGVNEPSKMKNTILGVSQRKPRRAKISLLSSGKSKSQEIIKKLGLPVFIYNNSEKQKVIQALTIKHSSDLLIIGRASIFQKQPNQIINSSTSRRSSIKILNETQLTASLQIKTSFQRKMSKLSGFYHNYTQQSQKEGSKKRFGRDKEKIRSSNIISKSQINFNLNLGKYLQIIKNNCQHNQLQYLDIEKYSENIRPLYKIEICNSNIVESVLKKRWWWQQLIPNNNRKPSLLWTQLKNDHFYEPSQKEIFSDSWNINAAGFLQQSRSGIQLHNHIENSRYVANRIALFQISQKINNIIVKIPKKYYIHDKQSQYWTKFQNQNYQQCKKKGKNILLGYLQQNNKMWIVKNAQNHHKHHFLKIFNNFNKIDSFLNENLSQKQAFIIQQYIQNPFLYKNRKFNVKCFALLTKIHNKVKFYWYEQGIIKISCQDYDKEKQNPYIHFASEGIQIGHPNFGQNQLSNNISFESFQEYVNSIDQNHHNFKRDALSVMKNTAKFVIEAAYNKINQQNDASFELLQFNYIIDSGFVPWLISSHTNPSLQVTCPVLQKLVPRLIDDMFKLSIDLYYPPPKTWPKNKYYLLSKNICQNGFQEIHLQPSCSQLINDFEFENKIQDQKRCYDSNVEQQDMTLMHFFPQKMKSTSRNSINFPKDP